MRTFPFRKLLDLTKAFGSFLTPYLTPPKAFVFFKKDKKMSNRGKNSIVSQISRIKAGKAKAVAKKGYGKEKNTRYLTKSKFKGQRVYIYVVKDR